MATLADMKLRWETCLSLCAALLLLGALTACETMAGKRDTGGTNLPPVRRVDPSTELLRAGDKLIIILQDIPGGPLLHEQAITEDGKITLHLNQEFTAAGRTRSQLQQDIVTRYVPAYYKRLTATIKVEDKFFFVQGEVKLPSRYVLSPDMSVLKAVSTAGGFTDFANRREVQLTRLSGEKFVIDCKEALNKPTLDLKVYAGDQVVVPRRF